MQNVYDNIKNFYNSLDERYMLISQNMVEGYLRKRAWEGASERDLRKIWNLIGWLFNYFIYADIEDLSEMDSEEYANALVWMADNNEVFVLSKESVDVCVDSLTDFFAYLARKKVVGKNNFVAAEIKNKFMQDGKFVKATHDRPAIFHEGFDENELDSELVRERLNIVIDKLLNKIGNYYKQEDYLNDFNRALALFAGSLLNSLPEETDESFWLGFWDYFLFDYHLLSNDKCPLEHFKASNKGLSHDERHIIDDLMKAEFTVFYISKILNDSTVSCVDLITGQKFVLPVPDYGLNNIRNVLLYGHVHPDGSLMLNYITSIAMSLKFRKRIRDEILRQMAIYRIQKPSADIKDFYKRYSIVVRHTIDILVNVAKVNVTSDKYLQMQFPVVSREKLLPDTLCKFLSALFMQYDVSFNSKLLLQTMAVDFVNLTDDDSFDERYLAAALVFAFAEINGARVIKKSELIRHLHLDKSICNEYIEKLYSVLKLNKFDPRYLNEEGFVLSLYEF